MNFCTSPLRNCLPHSGKQDWDQTGSQLVGDMMQAGPFFQNHFYADGWHQGRHDGTAAVAGEAALVEMALMLVEMIPFSEHPFDKKKESARNSKI